MVGGGMNYGNELPDDAPVLERLHWYAANYAVMKERAAVWGTRVDRLSDRIKQLEKRNEELVEEVAVLREECNRAWAAVRAAGATDDNGEPSNGW